MLKQISGAVFWEFPDASLFHKWSQYLMQIVYYLDLPKYSTSPYNIHTYALINYKQRGKKSKLFIDAKTQTLKQSEDRALSIFLVQNKTA